MKDKDIKFLNIEQPETVDQNEEYFESADDLFISGETEAEPSSKKTNVLYIAG